MQIPTVSTAEAKKYFEISTSELVRYEMTGEHIAAMKEYAACLKYLENKFADLPC